MGINLAKILADKNDNLPLIMGIVNATPDSFSDGGDSIRPLDKSLMLLDDGADIVDIGGESTRPNAPLIPYDEELKRVEFLVKSLRKLRPDAIISIDTRKKEVAERCLELGADIINDVSNLRYNKEIADIVARYQAGLILMHSLGTPNDMDMKCNYNDLISEVIEGLKESTSYAMSRGVLKDNIWIDAGLGFAKNAEQNFALLKETPELSKIAPVLVGHSRKRFIRHFLEVEIAEADLGTAAVSIYAMNVGAKILRVHDVKSNLDAIKMYNRCLQG